MYYYRWLPYTQITIRKTVYLALTSIEEDLLYGHPSLSGLGPELLKLRFGHYLVLAEADTGGVLGVLKHPPSAITTYRLL